MRLLWRPRQRPWSRRAWRGDGWPGSRPWPRSRTATAVQQRANAVLEAALGTRVGHKIGGTTEAMRRYIHVPEPLGGEIFASQVHPDGATVRRADFVRLGIETEIAVRLGDRRCPPRPEPYGRDEMADAVGGDDGRDRAGRRPLRRLRHDRRADPDRGQRLRRRQRAGRAGDGLARPRPRRADRPHVPGRPADRRGPQRRAARPSAGRAGLARQPPLAPGSGWAWPPAPSSAWARSRRCNGSTGHRCGGSRSRAWARSRSGWRDPSTAYLCRPERERPSWRSFTNLRRKLRPMQPDLILRGANLPDGRQGHDILIKDGTIQAVGEAIDARGHDELDVSGRLVCPPFVDCHFHMDATLSLGLPRLNRSGTLLEGIQLWNELKAAAHGRGRGRAGAGLLRHGGGAGHRRDPQPCRRLRRPAHRRRGAARGAAARGALPDAAAGGLSAGRPLPRARRAGESAARARTWASTSSAASRTSSARWRTAGGPWSSCASSRPRAA